MSFTKADYDKLLQDYKFKKSFTRGQVGAPGRSSSPARRLRSKELRMAREAGLAPSENWYMTSRFAKTSPTYTPTDASCLSKGSNPWRGMVSCTRAAQGIKNVPVAAIVASRYYYPMMAAAVAENKTMADVVNNVLQAEQKDLVGVNSKDQWYNFWKEARTNPRAVAIRKARADAQREALRGLRAGRRVQASAPIQSVGGLKEEDIASL